MDLDLIYIYIYIYFISWQVKYSLRETEWPSIRKRVLWHFCGLFASTVFVSWFRLSALLSILHSLVDSLQQGVGNECDIAALLLAAPLLSHMCCLGVLCRRQMLSWTLSQFVLPFLTHRLPNSSRPLESLCLPHPVPPHPFQHNPTPPPPPWASSPAGALNSPCFPPLSPCYLLSVCPITSLGHLLLHLLCLDMCLGPYQHRNPFPLLQTPLKTSRLVSLEGVAHLLFFLCWLLVLSQLGTPLW